MNKKALHYIQRNIYNIKKKIIFKSSHISLGGKIALLGAFISFVSLFYPWLSSHETILSSGSLQLESFTSFSGVLGRIGFFILSTIAIIVFAIFSIQKKEKLHYLSLIHISEYTSTLVGSVFILLLTIHSYLLVSGLQIFSSSIMYGKGITLCSTGAVVMIVGAIIIKKENRKNSKGSYINDGLHKGYQAGNNVEKNNMKLPF